MRKNVHSIVAVLLLILCVCIIPIASFAEDESTSSETSSVPEDSSQESSVPEPPPPPETVTISVQQITGGTIAVSATSVEVGQSFTATLTLDSGYDVGTLQYGDQKASGSGTISTTFVAKSGVTAVTGTAEKYPEMTLTVTGNGTVTSSPAQGKVAPGTKVTFTVTPNAGYMLSSIAGDNATVSKNESAGVYEMTMPNSNVSVTAVFGAAQQYAVKLSNAYDDGSGTFTVGTKGGSCVATVNSSTVTSAYPGAEVKITATPATGYLVSKISVVSGNDRVAVQENSNALTFTMPAGEVDVNVYYAKDTSGEHTLTVKCATSSQGTVFITDGTLNTTSVTSGKYNQGEELWIVAKAADGYTLNYMTTSPSTKAFTNSSGSETYSTVYYYAYKFIMPSTDITVTAYFNEDAKKETSSETTETSFTITTGSSEGGMVTVGNNKAAEGSSVSISAVPDNGYRFVGWTSTGGGEFADPTSEMTQFKMPGNDVTLIAQFEKVPGGGASETSSNGNSSSTPASSNTAPNRNNGQKKIPWLGLGIGAAVVAAAIGGLAVFLNIKENKRPKDSGKKTFKRDEQESMYDDVNNDDG
ncbi:MAG: hypothetical protein IKE18_06000 [Oscillospiraceae bacterium]|nr:hypothetical protein [Oscillospiraceae bacterium]